MPKSDKPAITTLSKDEIARVWGVVTEHLKGQPSIGNRKLRNLTGIGYDQAILFFRVMVREGRLERSGKGSATNYTMPKTGN
jgi:hypothetical protein